MSLGLFIPFILTWVAQRMLEYLVHHDSSNCTCWFYARIQDSIVNHSKETTDGLLILSVARSEIVGFSSIFFGRLNPFVFLIEPLFSQHDSQQEVGQGSEYNSRIQATLLWSGKNLGNKRKKRETSWSLLAISRQLGHWSVTISGVLTMKWVKDTICVGGMNLCIDIDALIQTLPVDDDWGRRGWRCRPKTLAGLILQYLSVYLLMIVKCIHRYTIMLMVMGCSWLATSGIQSRLASKDAQTLIKRDRQPGKLFTCCYSCWPTGFDINRKRVWWGARSTHLRIGTQDVWPGMGREKIQQWDELFLKVDSTETFYFLSFFRFLGCKVDSGFILSQMLDYGDHDHLELWFISHTRPC